VLKLRPLNLIGRSVPNFNIFHKFQKVSLGCRAAEESPAAPLRQGVGMAKQLAVLIGVTLLALPTAMGDTPVFKTSKEKYSYALGMEIGGGFRKQSLDLDTESLNKGIADAFSGAKTLLTEDEMRAVLKSAQEEFQKKQAALRAEKARANQEEGEAFLAANKNKEGVVTLPGNTRF
jgi:FKBP-type peptidyl-prolyl cis-trans isomerase FklB